ncbi:MAG: hypothetical protein ACKVWV_04115 [Planctomycetota bacterium]
MIFAFDEGGTLTVLAGLADVRREYETLDVESEAVRFYDARGTYLEPRFDVASGTGLARGGSSRPARRVFELVPKPSAGQDSFALALFETRVLHPNRWFTSLEQLKSELARRGVDVEFVRESPGDDE